MAVMCENGMGHLREKKMAFQNFQLKVCKGRGGSDKKY